MALKRALTEEQWQCLSTDPFPSGVCDGAVLHLIDTGEQYVFHDGMWESDLRDVAFLTTAP